MKTYNIHIIVKIAIFLLATLSVEASHVRLENVIRRSQCFTNLDCAQNEKCDGNKCAHVCDGGILCGVNAFCYGIAHTRICKCPPGYTGNPYVNGCREIGCHVDMECKDDEICKEKNCINVCEHNSCGRNANCTGINHTHICECPPGYSGDAFHDGCRGIRCNRDRDCTFYEKCSQEKCVHVCADEPSCGPDAICYGLGHTRLCRCLPEFIGNPEFSGCVKREIYYQRRENQSS